mgnify:CR=1 FL=1
MANRDQSERRLSRLVSTAATQRHHRGWPVEVRGHTTQPNHSNTGIPLALLSVVLGGRPRYQLMALSSRSLPKVFDRAGTSLAPRRGSTSSPRCTPPDDGCPPTSPTVSRRTALINVFHQSIARSQQPHKPSPVPQDMLFVQNAWQK